MSDRITAVDALRKFQKQCDPEGIEVQVSRQALDEVLAEIERLRGLVKMGEAVVEDFMPNIGLCALQDYARLNQFLCETAALKERDDG